MPAAGRGKCSGWWMKPDPNGLPSATTWRVLGRAAGTPALAWLALEPLTGRTHQLRVHCQAMGWPILGDTIYGNAPRHGGPGLHLHAREIVVPLYRNRPPIRVTAPLPPHLQARFRLCGWQDEPPRVQDDAAQREAVRPGQGLQ